MEPHDQINELLHAVEAAESCFAIWEFLILRDKGLEPYLLKRVFEEYRQFFLPTRHAHLVEVVMSLSRLYDQTDGAVSLLRCKSLRAKLKPRRQNTIQESARHREANRSENKKSW